MFPRENINFKIFPKAFEANARREYDILKILYSNGIYVPRPIELIVTENSVILVREYIEGEFFDEFIDRCNEDELRAALLNILTILKKVEDLGIYIEEFSSLYRNVVIRNRKPYIIDLERARYSPKSTITQFLGLLAKLCHNDSIKKKLEAIMETEKIKHASIRYKETRDINTVLSIFKKIDQQHH